MEAAAFSWHWLWLPLAMLASLISAQNVEMNRRAKQEGFRLNMWRTGYAAAFWLPVATLFFPWPHDGFFYAAAMFAGVGMIIGFTIQNGLAHRHNGRVAILYMPLKAVAVFLVWALISPQARAHLLANPLVAVGVLVCLAVMVGALAEFRKHDVSWQSLKAILPIVAVYGAGDILTRLNIPAGELLMRLPVFFCVATLTSTFVSLMLWPWRPKPELPSVGRKLARDGAFAAGCSMVNQGLFVASLVLAPSPAYASMILLLSPVWLLVYHKVMGMPDDANPLAGTVIVIAAVALMLLVA